jgi:PQQ-dependent dehydrogenase (s-GDH family)
VIKGNDGEAHPCEPNLAQALPTAEEVAKADWTTYQGKVLRIALDGSIPDDNPVLEGVRSHVYSCGHRNAQGLTFGPDGKLFVAEHGPRTDDEINLVEPGMNYGWPHVAGHQDDQAYAYAKWSASVSPACQDLEYSEMEVPASVPQQKESEWSHPDFRPPLATFYTVSSDHDFDDPACEGGPAYLCWPTIAPSSILVYEKYPAWIPGLAGSLVVTSLKLGQVLSIEMGIDGLPRSGAEPRVLLTTTDRLRDMALSPDGRALYVSTDAAGSMMGPGGEPTKDLAHQGAILEVRPVD